MENKERIKELKAISNALTKWSSRLGKALPEVEKDLSTELNDLIDEIDEIRFEIQKVEEQERIKKDVENDQKK